MRHIATLLTNVATQFMNSSPKSLAIRELIPACTEAWNDEDDALLAELRDNWFSSSRLFAVCGHRPGVQVT